MRSPSRIWASLSLSDRLGLASLVAALILLPLAWTWAALPLIAFLAVTALAPFFPRFPYFLPIRTHGSRSDRRIALTFDDGPDPATTPALLDLLEKRGVKAAFFLVGDRVTRYPELVSAIVAAGHEIGNHSFRHDVWLMLRSRRRLAEDLQACQDALLAHGVRTRAFRPPVGVTNPRLKGVLKDLRMICVNFDCRALDAGNRRIPGMARRLLRCARPGSILLLHDRRPRGEVQAWLAEIVSLLDGLHQRGLEPAGLGALLGFAVNAPETPRRPPPAEPLSRS